MLAVSAVVPVLLIQALGISRFALPKYVIYLLPIYLFAAGVGVVAVVGWWTLAGRRWLALGERQAAGVAASLMAAAVLLVAWLPVAEEYGQMVHDWRGAAAALGAAEAGDAVLLVALDTGDGFNAAGVVAPTYLDPGFRLIDGNHLTADEATALVGARGRVSALVLNLYAPVTVSDGRWVAANHQGSLYSVARRVGVVGGDVRRTQESATHADDVLEQIAALYGQLMPQAIPAAACDLALRLTHVQLARGEQGQHVGHGDDGQRRRVARVVGQQRRGQPIGRGHVTRRLRLGQLGVAHGRRRRAGVGVGRAVGGAG